MTETNLVTTYTFNGREYLVKMVAAERSLEIVVTDKNSGEEWECSYDSAYVESLTQKTGNFKKFSVFLCMLKNGLLKTSDCVSLDLLTYEDLQQLRSNCLRTHSSRCLRTVKPSERKYLIVNYNVEFDRIHYPLPLDYTGPPDPVILQSTVHRLQKELQKVRDESRNNTHNTKESKKIQKLQERIDDLASENAMLRQEIRMLKQKKDGGSSHKVQTLQKAILNLEKSVLSERKSHYQLVEKLRSEKSSLMKELNEVKMSEQRLKNQLSKIMDEATVNRKNLKILNTDKKPTSSMYTIYRNTNNMKRNNSGAGGNNLNNKTFKPPPVRRTRSTPDNQRAKSSRSSSLSKYSNSSVNDTTVESSAPFVRRRRRRKASTSRSRDSSLTSNGSKRLGAHRHEIDFDELQKKIESLQNMLEVHT